MLIDLCGVDYSLYGAVSASESDRRGKRFAAVYHLLSISHNRRLRVRIFADDDEFPVLDSVIGIWPSANWFEREAFDLYGIVFTGHPDLRRILTDYGFIGNPFRKDFPLSGNVEMRYDPDQATGYLSAGHHRAARRSRRVSSAKSIMGIANKPLAASRFCFDVSRHENC